MAAPVFYPEENEHADFQGMQYAIEGTASGSGCATRLCTVKPKASISSGHQYRSNGWGCGGYTSAGYRRMGEWGNQLSWGSTVP